MANHENDAAKAARRTRMEARDDQGEVVSYIDENGTPTAFTGNQDAPYTIPLGRVSDADGESQDGPADINESQRILVDDEGRIIISPDFFPSITVEVNPILIARSTALQNSLVVKATPGFLSEARMLVTTGIATTRWLHIFDAIAAPANGATPVWRAVLLPPGGIEAEVADSFESPLTFSIGIVLAISTTGATYTAPSGTEALFSAGYV